jgi:CRP-like cAMP-binding protein
LSPSAIEKQIGQLALMLEFNDEMRDRVAEVFCAASTQEQIPAGTQLFAEGDEVSNDGYVLLKGTVTVERSSGFRKQVHPPELLGEMKQFEFEGPAERAATATAAEDVEVLHFNWDTFYERLKGRIYGREKDVFNDALQRYAWMHFLEIEEEL